MVVGKGVIDAHVLEEPFYVLVEESLDFAVVELRVDKEGTNVGLHDVRESLNILYQQPHHNHGSSLRNLWSCLCRIPVISCPIGVLFHFFEILHIFTVLALNGCAV